MSEIHEDHRTAKPRDPDTPPGSHDPLVVAIGADSSEMAVDGRDTTAWGYIALFARHWASSAIPGNAPGRDGIADAIARTVAAAIWPYITAAASDRAVALAAKFLDQAGTGPRTATGGTEVMISRAEASAIREALFHEAAELRRKAKLRDVTGRAKARYREVCRANARYSEELARRIGREFG